MAGFLLDTNHLSKALTKVSPLRDLLRQTHRQGIKLGTTWGVLCEIEAGLAGTRNPDHFRRRLKALLGEITIWPLDWEIARFYGQFCQETRTKGRVLSHVDLVSAAVAFKHGATLLTADKDFEAFPQIRTENWLL